MKKIFLLFLSLISYTAFTQSLARITGQIKNPTERKVSIVLYKNFVEEEETYELNLDATNKFKFETTLNDIAYFDLYCGDESCHYWVIEPGDNLNITLDAKRFWESFLVTGKGNQKWVYYLQERKKFQEDHDWRFQADTWRKLSLEQYFENLDNEERLQINFLNTYKPLVSIEFFELRKADIVGEIQNMKVDMLTNQKYKDMDEEESKNFIKTDNLSPKAKAQSLEFGNLQINIAEMTATKFAERKQRPTTETEQYNFLKANYISNEIDRDLAERLLAFKLKLLLADAGSASTPERQALVNDYVNFTMNREFRNFVVAKADFLKTLKAGFPAKDFELTDSLGKVIKLHDLKGKIVLLDFWASWCGPCIYDLKQMESIKKFYLKNKEVVFVSISIDKDYDWRESLRKLPISGINLRADEGSQIMKDYGVLGVPAYFLIDKKGNFAVTQVADPHEEDGKALIKQIEDLLLQK